MIRVAYGVALRGTRMPYETIFFGSGYNKAMESKKWVIRAGKMNEKIGELRKKFNESDEGYFYKAALESKQSVVQIDRFLSEILMRKNKAFQDFVAKEQYGLIER